MYYLTEDLVFPDANSTSTSGILAIGGDLSPERLQLAYKNGIFPWFEEGEPICWWSPKERMVLFLDELFVSKSMKKVIAKNIFSVTYNRDFRAVISNCQKVKREGQNGTWITDEMLEAYCRLHELGIAKSIEVWQASELVGGLYGIDIKPVFCGESMFSRVSNASKVAFVALAELLRKENYDLLDCQVYNPHLESLGCREIDRADFLTYLKKEADN